MRALLTDGNIERAARALCRVAGDDPDRKTYPHEMNCTGRSDVPEFRWMYWIPFAKAALMAIPPQKSGWGRSWRELERLFPDNLYEDDPASPSEQKSP